MSTLLRRRSSMKKSEDEEEEEDIISERLVEYIVVIGPQDEEEGAPKDQKEDDPTAKSGSSLQQPSPPDSSLSPDPSPQPDSSLFDREEKPTRARPQAQTPPQILVQEASKEGDDLHDTVPIIVLPNGSAVDGSLGVQDDLTSQDALTPEIGSPQFMEKFGSTFWFEEPICSLQLVKPTLGEDVR